LAISFTGAQNRASCAEDQEAAVYLTQLIQTVMCHALLMTLFFEAVSGNGQYMYKKVYTRAFPKTRLVLGKPHKIEYCKNGIADI
jgi:hypothetical protein